MRSPSRLALCAVLGVSLSCASGGSPNSAPRQDSSVITRSQILQYQYRTALEAVQALHSPWLTIRGADSFTNPGQVWVYLNEARFGGVETLRDIAAPSIEYIRHYDGIAASARWGLDHGQGVIYVATRTR